MFYKDSRLVARLLLILIVAFLAGTNVFLDFSRGDISREITGFVVFSIIASALATAFPSLVAFLVGFRSKFTIGVIKVYVLAADIVLAVTLSAWIYLVFIRVRPEFYEGASHLYVVTWPFLLGFIAVALYLVCLSIQFIFWLASKHNKAINRRQQAG